MAIFRKLDPINMPATTRVVIKDRRISPDAVFEVVIVEWTPSGGAVHLRYPERNNVTLWTDDFFDGAVVETL